MQLPRKDFDRAQYFKKAVSARAKNKPGRLHAYRVIYVKLPAESSHGVDSQPAGL